MAKKQVEKREGLTPRVLIADDDESLGSVLKDLFEAAGFAVKCTNTVATSIDRVTRERFDVIILDMRMPEKPGEEVEYDAGLVISQVLEHLVGTDAATVVVVFTAYPSVEDCFSISDAGVYYLPKNLPRSSIDRSLIEELVDACVRRVSKKIGRCDNRRETWLEEHYEELVRNFAGKAVAIVDALAARQGGVTDALNIGGRAVFAAENTGELRERIVKNPALRRAMPLIVNVLDEPESI